MIPLTEHKAFDELSSNQVDLLRSLITMHDEFGLAIYKNFVRAIVDDADDDDDHLPTRLEGSE